MPLEVIATLDRDVAVYFSGETIRLTVLIKNTGRGKQSIEHLAWGSVQFVCDRVLGRSTLSIRQRPTTSVPRSSSTVYTSKPDILFCELQLAPGQSKQFQCEIPLSRNAIPPTFKGYHVKYSNWITIAVSHVLAHIKMVNLPIRIFPSVGLETKISLPLNPFLSSETERPDVVETVMATVDDLTMARKSLAFSLNLSQIKIALLTLPKKAFKLGEDVCGYLDFRDAKMSCIQYSVSIETEEMLLEEKDERKEIVKIQCQTAPICLFSPDGAFKLNIPLTATPTFSTDTVRLKWKIRLVFVVTDPIFAEKAEEEKEGNLKAPNEMVVESFSWSTDILVLPCKPQNSALVDNSFPNNVKILV